jgi:hypothetical protein
VRNTSVSTSMANYLSSFSAGNDERMLSHKLDVRRRLKDFNDESFPEGCTLDTLKCRRMSIARDIFGKLGCGVNIEGSFFCTVSLIFFFGVGMTGCHADCRVYRNQSGRWMQVLYQKRQWSCGESERFCRQMSDHGSCFLFFLEPRTHVFS